MKKAGTILLILTGIFLLVLVMLLIIKNCGETNIRMSGYDTHHVNEDSSLTTAPTDYGLTNGRTININTASIEELTLLPGINRSVAQKIIDYRTLYGPYQSKEALRNVQGLSLQTLERIYNYITIGGNQ